MFARLFSTGIILLITSMYLGAVQIEGFWKVNGSGDVVEIRSFGDGIQAKFVNKGDWTSYELLRKNIYEDRKGNRYYIKSNNKMNWESRDGRTTFKLTRTNDYYGNDGSYRSDRYNYGNDRYDDGRYNYETNRQGRYDQEYGDAHVCGRECRNGCILDRRDRRNRYDRYDRGISRQLSGTWVNRWKNRIAYVDFDGYTLRMKTNRSRRWTKYYRTSARKLRFEDKYGNRIRFKRNGEMEWRRADRGREIEFRKAY